MHVRALLNKTPLSIDLQQEIQEPTSKYASIEMMRNPVNS